MGQETLNGAVVRVPQPYILEGGLFLGAVAVDQEGKPDRLQAPLAEQMLTQ